MALGCRDQVSRGRLRFTLRRVERESRDMPSRQPPARNRARRSSELAYLNDFNDPGLPADRQYTLSLMLEVERIREAHYPFPPAADATDEMREILDSSLCPNCRKSHQRAKIFCGDQCEQEAQVVRHIRNVVADGRIRLPDRQEGIGHKLIQIVAGGYPSERKLSPKLRMQVLERDRRICQICRSPGDQIDHIDGNANDPSNLRVLCSSCNRGLVLRNMAPTIAEDATWIQGILSRLALRIAAPQPLYLCDGDDWARTWPLLRSERRRVLREIEEMEDCEFEDEDSYLAHAMGKDD